MSENTESVPFPWDSITYEFTLSEVQLIATFGHDGGAIAERVPKLVCSEGRLFSYTTHGGKPLHQLEYFFGFAQSDDPDPMASSSSLARIVIVGIHENGLKIEIRGDGWAGYDDKGNLEGRFEHPPIVITEDDEPEINDTEELTHEDFMSGAEVRMPPNYRRATTRVTGWTDDE